MMRARGLRLALALAALLPVAGPLRAGWLSPPEQDEDLEPRPEQSWNAMSHEAKTLLGETKYQRGDMSGARESFRDSLGASMRVTRPETQWMALDLFRNAEFELRNGNTARARHQLEILTTRYPRSSWAEKGRRLLAVLPGDSRLAADDAAVAVYEEEPDPDAALLRLQAALRSESVQEGIELSKRFLKRFPRHPAAEEVRLAQGLLRVYGREPREAAALLAPLARDAANASVRSKARYALGALYLLSGDAEGAWSAVPAADPAATRDKWEALAQVWRAVSELRSGERTAAVSRLKAALRAAWKSPAQAYARVLLAAELAREGRLAAAAESARQAAALAQEWDLREVAIYARLAVGHLFYGQRRYDEAAGAYQRFLLSYPDHPQAAQIAYQRALALKWAGRKDQAVAAFNELVRRHADSPVAASGYLQLGQIYSQRGAPEAAVSAYQKMGVAGAGLDKDALLLTAQVHYNRRDFGRAIPLYERFLGEVPDDARGPQVEQLLLSSYWLGARQDPGLERAVERYPRHAIAAQIRWHLGSAAFKAKDFSRAERQLARLAADFPKSPFAPDAFFYLAESRMRLGDFDGAAQAFRDAAARFPKHARGRQARFRLGLALYQAGRYEEAADAYKGYARAGGPLAADALFNRALADEKAGRKEALLADYEELVRRFPKHARASWALLQVGLLRESLELLEPAARAYAGVKGEGRSQALYQLGRVRERLRQAPAARLAYRALLSVRPEDDPYRLRGLLRLALLSELKDPRQALSLYREISRRDRQDELGGVALKRMRAIFADKRLLPAAPRLPR